MMAAVRKRPTGKGRQRALTLLKQVRRVTARELSPLRGMTEAQILQRLRKTRERLWAERVHEPRPPPYHVLGRLAARKQPTKKDRQRAVALMEEMQRLSDNVPSSLRGMTKAEIIRHMRETREHLWEEKLAALGA